MFESIISTTINELTETTSLAQTADLTDLLNMKVDTSINPSTGIKIVIFFVILNLVLSAIKIIREILKGNNLK